jgi:hypothetical protein
MSHIIQKPHLEVDLPGPPTIPPKEKKKQKNLKLKYTNYKLLNGWMNGWMDGWYNTSFVGTTTELPLTKGFSLVTYPLNQC